jgi:threonine dehydratase
VGGDDGAAEAGATETGAFAVTVADIEAAARRIAGVVVRTPTLRSATLSAITGCELWVKFENLQFTASFKDRGAANRLLQLTDDERRRGVVCMSAGNHAQAVAHRAAELGIPATIVMPRFTPNVKVANTERFGARVVLYGDDLGEAGTEARRIAAAEGLVWVPPYDDAAVIAGQGTCALELLDDAGPLDTLVVPCGGGGLIGGMAVVARALRPDIEIVGVQSDRYPAMVRAVTGTEAPVGGSTIAEGIAVPVPGTLTTPLVAALVDRLVAVDDARIEQAVALFAEIEKTVAEGAGAAGLAAILADPAAFAGKRVGVVLCGGNIDARILSQVLMRNLVRSGRLRRALVDISDTPGSLARVATVVAEHGGNIIEVAHGRLSMDLAVTSAELEVVFETRGAEHADAIAAALRDHGFRVRLVNP